MKTILLTDTTLKESFRNGESLYTFKERVELAKVLDRIHADAIRLSPIVHRKADTTVVRTIASVVNDSVLSMPTGYTTEAVDLAYEAVRSAKKPELYVGVPTSPLQMEYLCHKKAPAVLEMIASLVARAHELTPQVNFAAEDATRSEFEFLCQAIGTAIEKGATTVTLCDTAGCMLPDAFADFVRRVREAVPALAEVRLAVQCNDALSLGAACAIAAVQAGADEVIVTVGNGHGCPELTAVAEIVRQLGMSAGLETHIRYTELQRALRQIGLVTRQSNSEEDTTTAAPAGEVLLDSNDDQAALAAAVRQLGYELSEEDLAKVYESFLTVVSTKPVGTRELEAIVATVALQVPPVYKLTDYVVHSGSSMTPTAHIRLTRDGKEMSGLSAGHGPIDAAFFAIDSIVGRHYELDDFQIQAVTQGRDSMGSALVRLRSNGKLYSGNGISTDIIGASVRAYVNAINKIAYEENQKA